MAKSYSSDIFAVLSNAIRRETLVHLRKRGLATFTELMHTCNLDIEWDCGTLGYHLNQLLKEGAIRKSEEGYKLTNFGVHLVNLLEGIGRAEVKRELAQKTIMFFGRAASIGYDCGGIIAKHVKRGDKVYAVVEGDAPQGARITEMLKAEKKYLGLTDFICLADYAPELRGIGETIPFLEHTLVPPLIKVVGKLRPNIVITFNPGESVTPSPAEVLGRALWRALHHTSWYYWRDRMEIFPSVYCFTWGQHIIPNYVVDISEVLQDKKEYVRFYLSHFFGRTAEEAKKTADEIEPYEKLKMESQLPIQPEELWKHVNYEYLQ